jgi:hypothetical protein
MPNDEAKLARVARMSLKKWRAMSPELMPFFIVQDDKISHGRLTKELQKSERQSQSRAAAGARGGAANALKYNRPREALAQAGLKHLPEPYRKEGAVASVPTDGLVLYRTRADHEAMWLACEEAMGWKVKSYLSSYTFPADIVAKAKAAIEARASVH